MSREGRVVAMVLVALVLVLVPESAVALAAPARAVSPHAAKHKKKRARHRARAKPRHRPSHPRPVSPTTPPRGTTPTLPPTPAPRGSSYTQGTWTGLAYNDGDNVTSTFTFTVSGSEVSDVVARTLGCYDPGAGSYQVISLAMPTASPIAAGGALDDEVPLPQFNGALDAFKGTFTGAGAAAGTLAQTGGLGVCDYGYKWVAQPGTVAPAQPAPPPPPACTLGAVCASNDGLQFQVGGVDTTLESVADPNNPYVSPDGGLAGGGVLVSLTITNPSAAPIYIAPETEFKLLDGAGSYDAARDEDAVPIDLADGNPLPANACNGFSQPSTVPAGGSVQLALCFAVPTGAQNGLRMLYDYPTTKAEFPLN